MGHPTTSLSNVNALCQPEPPTPTVHCLAVLCPCYHDFSTGRLLFADPRCFLALFCTLHSQAADYYLDPAFLGEDQARVQGRNLLAVPRYFKVMKRLGFWGKLHPPCWGLRC